MALLYAEESRLMNKLCLDLHNEMGCGFKEKVYQDAFEVLLKENNIPYVREKHITYKFHGIELAHDFFWDFYCWDKIGVELKAYSEIIGEFEAQIINYLKVSDCRLGLLVNFGTTSLEYKWFPNRPDYNKHSIAR